MTTTVAVVTTLPSPLMGMNDVPPHEAAPLVVFLTVVARLQQHRPQPVAAAAAVVVQVRVVQAVATVVLVAVQTNRVVAVAAVLLTRL